MPLAAWLVSLVGPLVARALTQLTIGFVTYKGLDIAINGLLNQVRANWAGIPSDLAAYLAISGGNTAISIIVGALVARLSMIPLKRMRFK